jgi:hypothetical protein
MNESSAFYRHLGQVRRRYCWKKSYPKWEAFGANLFIYYFDENTWVEDVHRHSVTGLWVAGKTYQDTEHHFEDIEEALLYAEGLAFPKLQQYKFQKAKTCYMGTMEPI